MAKPLTAPTLRFGELTKLPAILTRAWRETILEMGKFPKGTAVATGTEESLLKTLVRSERGAITNLWKTFTSDRTSLTVKTLTDKKNSVAYLLGFHLPNAARVLHAITAACRRASIKPALEGFKKAMIVDLGCGSGAMAQASLWLLRSLQNPIDDVEVRLVDGSAPLLDTAKLLLTKTYPNCRIRAHRGKIDGLLTSKYLPDADTLGIYNLGYVWNEVEKNSRAKGKMIDLLQALVEKNLSALVFVVEPGSQDQSRSTMVLRNRLVAQGFQVQYPCPSNRDCPMLDRARDWCYSEINWQPPPIQRLIDQQIGIDRTKLAASCYVFATPKLAKLIKARTTKMTVVVGRPVKGTRATVKTTEIEYLTCSDSGIKKAKIDADALPLARGELLEFTLNS